MPIRSVKSARFFHSLRFKITVGVAVPLLIILTLFSTLEYVRHRRLVTASTRHFITDLNEVLEQSLRQAFLSGDPLLAQQVVDDVFQHYDIENVYVLDKSGQVKAAPGGAKVGQRLDQADPTCQICHRLRPEARSQTVAIGTAHGEVVFRSVVPIINGPECADCHDPAEHILGVLVTDFSTGDVERQLAADLRNHTLWSAITIVVVVAAVNLMMNRLVVDRVSRFLVPIRRMSEGDFSVRVAVDGPEQGRPSDALHSIGRGRDEIGELAGAFNRMAEGLAEKAELEQQVRILYREMEQRVQELSAEVQNLAVLEERDRIGREMHDGLAQTLSYLNLEIRVIESLLASGDVDRAREEIAQLKAAVDEAYEDVREAISNLRTTLSPDKGLLDTLREYLCDFGLRYDLKTELILSDGHEVSFSPAEEVQLIRIVQEALSNVRKHARARHVVVRFDQDDSRTTLTVEDDGQGFDLAAKTADKGYRRHFGLDIMRERADSLGASLEIEATPGRGTRVRVDIPRSDPMEKEHNGATAHSPG